MTKHIRVLVMSLFFAFGAVAISGSPAQADWLIEPYLGYHTGKLKVSSADSDANGVTYGGRLGFQSFTGLMLGADYMTGAWTAKTNPHQDMTPKELGVFVGYDFPVLMRVYATYFFDSKLDFDNGSNLEGHDMRLGVGFKTLIPLVTINLEYGFGNYDKSHGHSLSNEYKTNYYGLTVSLPLTL